MDGTYLRATSVQPLPASVQPFGSVKMMRPSLFLYVEPRSVVRPGENQLQRLGLPGARPGPTPPGLDPSDADDEDARGVREPAL
jgi:hypothetical protein